MKKKTALIDMDNTLFDYEGQLRKDLEKIRSSYEPAIEDLWDESVEWINNRMHLIKSNAGWWENLPKFKLGWDIYEVLKKLEFECCILTKAPRRINKAWTEKVQCIVNHFGEDVDIDIVRKSKHRTFGHVLVDDYPDYAST